MRTRFSLSLFLLSLCWGAPVDATVLTEMGDAGELPSSAQIAPPPGMPSAIEGFFDAFSDQDMFRLFIPDLSLFAASANNSGTNLTDNSDVQLFLFDENGVGVFANDDDPKGQGSLKSAFPAGSLAGPPGFYFIAISMFDNDPIGFSGEIFPDGPNNEVVQPLAPGSSSSEIAAWNFDQFPAQVGPYRIELTYVPEPATTLAGFVAAALCAFACRRRVVARRDG